MTNFNRRKADRRRAVAQTMRDIRERLTSATGTTPAFDFELAAAFARNRLSAAYVLPLLILLAGGTALLWLQPNAVVSWALLALAAHLVTIVLCRHFTGSKVGGENIRKWHSRFLISDAVSGSAWGMLLILTARSTGPGLEVFQFATTLTVISVGSMIASTLPAAAVAATLPMVFMAAAVFVSHGGVLHIALTVMAVGAEVFFLILSSRLYQATLSLLESRAEQDLLIAELGTAKAISDEARRRAEEANLAKSRFLATMSHELRTPLNAILGFSEVMKNEVLGPIENANYKDYAGDIHSSGKHLLDLINEILDLSRIEAGRYELSEEPVNLAHLVEDCRHLVSIKARAKGITLIENIDQRMPRLWADERAIRQITLNLLSNAVKFTPQGGEIVISVGVADNGGQFLSIRDNGPGIAPEELPIVLAAFGQGAIAAKHNERGTGLGLTIVQALVRMHKGMFDLRSKLREGTEAICTLPKDRVMEALPPVIDEQFRGLRRKRA